MEAKHTERSNRRVFGKGRSIHHQNQIGQQEAYLPVLATTGNLTPFIGLLEPSWASSMPSMKSVFKVQQALPQLLLASLKHLWLLQPGYLPQFLL